MSIQSDNLRAYSTALKNPRLDAKKIAKYRAAIDLLVKYIDNFLTSPDGTFYVSQDADAIPGQHAEKYFSLDDQHRRQIAIPKVDQHVYARENGWMISSLLDYYAATEDEAALDKATRAATWIIAHRKNATLFTHDQTDKAGPYLGDNISMASAFLKLYLSTGDRKWLNEADTLAKTVLEKFSNDSSHPGLATTVVAGKDAEYEVKPQFEENLKAARFYNLLSHYTGKKEYKQASVSIFTFLASSVFEGSVYASTAILNIDNELANPPLHIVVSGKKADPQAKLLFKTALGQPRVYKILEWWDKAEGPLPNPDDSYPQLDRAAAFVCAEHRCSFPAFKPEDIAIRVKQLSGDDEPAKKAR